MNLRPEELRQIAAHRYLDAALPPDALKTAIDHAHKSTPAVRALMKARGIRSGIADWYILWNGITVWAEQKTPGGSLQDNQIEFGQDAVRAGAVWGVFVELEELEALLLQAGIPLRAVEQAGASENAARKPDNKPRRTFGGGPIGRRPTQSQLKRVALLREKVPF